MKIKIGDIRRRTDSFFGCEIAIFLKHAAAEEEKERKIFCLDDFQYDPLYVVGHDKPLWSLNDIKDKSTLYDILDRSEHGCDDIILDINHESLKKCVAALSRKEVSLIAFDCLYDDDVDELWFYLFHNNDQGFEGGWHAANILSRFPKDRFYNAVLQMFEVAFGK